MVYRQCIHGVACVYCRQAIYTNGQMILPYGCGGEGKEVQRVPVVRVARGRFSL